jgi:hypothetical protein
VRLDRLELLLLAPIVAAWLSGLFALGVIGLLLALS